jgi:hypothetical protein
VTHGAGNAPPVGLELKLVGREEAPVPPPEAKQSTSKNRGQVLMNVFVKAATPVRVRSSPARAAAWISTLVP